MVSEMLQSNGMGSQIHCLQKVLPMCWVASVTSEDLTAICAHATAHMFLLAPMTDTSSKWRDGGQVQALKTSSWREQSPSHSGGAIGRSQTWILCLVGVCLALPEALSIIGRGLEQGGAGPWSPSSSLACVSHELLAPAPDGLAEPARDAAKSLGNSRSTDCHIHHGHQAVVFSLSLKVSSLRLHWGRFGFYIETGI